MESSECAIGMVLIIGISWNQAPSTRWMSTFGVHHMSGTQAIRFVSLSPPRITPGVSTIPTQRKESTRTRLPPLHITPFMSIQFTAPAFFSRRYRRIQPASNRPGLLAYRTLSLKMNTRHGSFLRGYKTSCVEFPGYVNSSSTNRFSSNKTEKTTLFTP